MAQTQKYAKAYSFTVKLNGELLNDESDKTTGRKNRRVCVEMERSGKQEFCTVACGVLVAKDFRLLPFEDKAAVLVRIDQYDIQGNWLFACERTLVNIRWSVGPWDNSTDDVLLERLSGEVEYEYMTYVQDDETEEDD